MTYEASKIKQIITKYGFPESYNVIYKNNENYWYIASAINNLNWARAMFSILLDFLSN